MHMNLLDVDVETDMQAENRWWMANNPNAVDGHVPHGGYSFWKIDEQTQAKVSGEKKSYIHMH